MTNQLIDKSDMIERVKNKVLEVLNTTDEITYEENLALRGLDSLRTVELVVELEEMFNVTFDDEEMLTENFSSIDKIKDRLLTKF